MLLYFQQVSDDSYDDMYVIYESDDEAAERDEAGVALADLVAEPGWQAVEDVGDPAGVRPFREATGPTDPLPHDARAVDFLHQMVGADFFAKLAAATNANAARKRPPAKPRDDPTATSDLHWHATTEDEMRAFIGINIAMGLKDLADYRDCWSDEPILHDTFVAGVMPRCRYEKLFQYFHCSLPADEVADDKLASVRPLIAVFTENFHRCFAPCQDLSIDEAIIRYDGRLAWKQYTPKKPVKWGIKLWCLCDSFTGYCLAFYVYTGAMNDAAGLDFGYDVAMSLMRRHLRRRHHLYADSFFTSVHLAVDLLRANTYLCGLTCATRCQFPKTLAAARLRRGESAKWVSDDGVMLVKWRDRRDVFIIATNDTGEDLARRAGRDGQPATVAVPVCVRRYDEHMGEVDQLHQLRTYYGVGRSGRRWWKYLFWGLLNVGLINAYTLWVTANRPLPANTRFFSLTAFKVKVVHDLCDGHVFRSHRPPPTTDKLTVARVITVVAGHTLVKWAGRKRVCQMCASSQRKTCRGRSVESSFGCGTCRVYLCRSGLCFRKYHK